MVTPSALHGSISPRSKGLQRYRCVMGANPAPGACLRHWCWLVLPLTLLPRGFWGSFVTLGELHAAERVRRFITEKTSTVEMFQSPAVAVEVYFKFIETFTEVLSLPPRPLKPSMLRLPLQLGQSRAH